MSTKAALTVAVLAIAGFAGGAYARADLTKDALVIAADDGASKMPSGQMPTDGMKPGDQAQPDDQGGATGSAKMGTDEGTHTGDDQGSKPESDTSKVDQPARRNVPSNEDGTGQK